MKLSISLLLLVAAAATLQAEPAYALNGRNVLLRFDTNTPGFTDATQIIRGLQPGESLLAIDFRPANGALYGLGSHSRLYTIDPATGQSTAIGNGPFTPALEGTEFGFDFIFPDTRFHKTKNTANTCFCNFTSTLH